MKVIALRCYLWLMHVGWSLPAACALFVCGLVLIALGLPAERAIVLKAQRRLAEATAALAAPPNRPQTRQATTAQGLTKFYASLGQYGSVESQVSVLFRTAREAGLLLRQAEYRAGFDRSGQFYTYKVILPVRGSYVAIRRFCEETLTAIPFVSLDEVHFKRGAIGEATVDAKLQFTLFLTGGKDGSKASTPIAVPREIPEI
ncbi:hypothetical protein [Cupriavidus sp. H39]|uniref:hypothetical protein n=1 Tax=Cupriavidus sp. H39 TaxID=3401635 RepID=UPI003D015343